MISFATGLIMCCFMIVVISPIYVFYHVASHSNVHGSAEAYFIVCAGVVVIFNAIRGNIEF